MKKETNIDEISNLNLKIEQKLQKSIIIIDKKEGVTSADEVYELRRIFKNKERKRENKIKIGHSGTLDPKVTGVLVMGLGKGTKVLEYILLSKKVYETEIIFHKKVTRNDFQKALKKFTGVITQLPPVKSSVKRKERQREIYNLKLTFFSSDQRSAKFISSVERGTYIRKLCHDMGEFLGTSAHMGQLRRIQAGVFNLENSKIITTKKIKELYNSNSIKDKKTLLSYFYNIEELFNRLDKNGKIRKIFINKESEKYIKSGNPIRIKNFISGKYSIKKNEIFSIFIKNKDKEEVLGIGTSLKKINFEINNIIDEYEDWYEEEIIKLKKII